LERVSDVLARAAVYGNFGVSPFNFLDLMNFGVLIYGTSDMLGTCSVGMIKYLFFFSINLAPVELMVLTVLFPGVAARGNFELFRACSARAVVL